MTVTYYLYDFAGWYAGSTDQQQDRITEIAPTNLTVTQMPGELRSNWTGYEWIQLSYVHSVEPIPVGQPWEWFIDIGPFFDRFGAQKLAVLGLTNGTVQAILRDVQVRKWIDLKRPDVAQALAVIGNFVPAVNAAMQTAILTTPVTAEENLALRKMYFHD